MIECAIIEINIAVNKSSCVVYISVLVSLFKRLNLLFFKLKDNAHSHTAPDTSDNVTAFRAGDQSCHLCWPGISTLSFL